MRNVEVRAWAGAGASTSQGWRANMIKAGYEDELGRERSRPGSSVSAARVRRESGQNQARGGWDQIRARVGPSVGAL